MLGACAAALSAASAFAQDPVLPEIGGENNNCQLYGWTWTTLQSGEVDPLGMVRLRANCQTDSPLGLFIELDTSRGIGDDENWLR